MNSQQSRTIIATVMAVIAAASAAQADIYQWEYINPADPSLGKQQSATLAPDGAGVSAAPGANLSNRDLTKAYLSSADLSAYTVVDDGGALLYSIRSDLTAVNLSQADLTNATFNAAKLTNANLSGADVRGASFHPSIGLTQGSGLTLAQLYSTASYLTHDLTGIFLGGDYAGGNFSGQNLSHASIGPNLNDANFSQANLRDANLYGTLTGANLSGSEVRGASFSGSVYGPLGGLTLAQLYSTASYQAHDLSGIRLFRHDLSAGDFAGQGLAGADLLGSALVHADFRHANLSGVRFTDFFGGAENPEVVAADLTGANLSHTNLTNAIVWSGYTTLTGVNLTGADARGALGFDPIPATAIVANLIRPDGHVAGLDLTAGASLVVRDYDGNPAADPPVGALPIVVEQHLAMDATGGLQVEFGADPWGSTISFAPGISVALGGTLELEFASNVDPASQLGRTIDLFDWTGVLLTGAFNVASPHGWDLSQLYITGEVTFTAAGGLIPGDFNGDSVVDAADLADWKGDFGVNGASDADGDGDGDSDGADFLSWQRQLGQGAPGVTQTASVPEPASLAMVAIGVATLAVRRVRRICPWLCLLCGLSVAAPSHALTYTITDLGALGGTDSLPWAINNLGQVAGYAATTDDLSIEGFLWTPTTPNAPTGSMLGLESLHGVGSWATSINGSGQVAGVSFEGEVEGEDEHATLWSPANPNGTTGTLHDLGTLGGTYSEAHGINDLGQVSGAADIAGDAATHAFMWKPSTPGGSTGTMYDLGSLGGSFTIGWDVNAGGAVTGGSDVPDDSGAHPFLWKPTTPNGTTGTMHDLGTLGGTDGDGIALNDSGQVTGSSQTTDDAAYRAFLWTPTTPGGVSGVMQDLGTLGGTNSYGIAINAAGQVVGAAEVPAEVSNYTHAFLYTPGGGMVDLNTFVDPLSGWELLDADAINDVGQITGQGLINEEYHAFLLTPLAALPGDFDLDGFVNEVDLALWKTGFGASGNAALIDGDADGDQDVDGADFLMWQRQLTSTPEIARVAASAVVPEPSSNLLLVLTVGGALMHSHASVGRRREKSKAC